MLKVKDWDKFATWAYSVGLPFNAVRDEGFQDMINAIGEYGRVSDDDENDKVRQDLNLYIDSVGQFGSTAAIRGRKKVAPFGVHPSFLHIMKGSRTTVLTFAEKCKNILASNWQGSLNTVKADAKGSKDDIYSSKVKYFVKKGRPYIWVPEDDLHNVNTVIDERGSLSVTSPLPGSLANLLQSLKKPPNRIALVGELVPLGDKKVKSAAESLRETLISEGEAIKAFSYSVTGVLSSSDFRFTSRAENLQELLTEDQQYRIYKFNPSSITYIEGKENSHEVDLKELEESKADSLSLFSASLIDGINQSEARRRALMMFCATYLNKNVKDALVLSIDRKGLDVLGKVVGPIMDDGSREYQWKEMRLLLEEEAPDVETFCKRLVEMEKETIKNVSSFSGLPLEPNET
ncbi:hypothetical protein L1987_35963 [Smallanthus sonchifolius]|uniref:Uncharacterized protein n=1 Tax=Smallanthus sonchifolius TaxID=185202 RepID=A0ACB9HDJ3_9ASTR|nr:hypothetical protein L1987_35963 [Smallanthus sonchifolius]